MSYNLAADIVFTQRNFVADFFQAILEDKRLFCVFESSFGGLRGNGDDHLRLIGKRVVQFLLVLIELFSLGVTVEALPAIICSQSAI